MVKFATNVSGAILLPSSIQVTESISGSVVPLAMFDILVPGKSFPFTERIFKYAQGVSWNPAVTFPSALCCEASWC